MTRLLLLFALPLAAGAVEQPPVPSAVAAHPRIVAIEFAGNEVTQPRVMLREIPLKVGDPADPVAIEAARQAIQDLGLFREVQAETLPAADGVTLRFALREKFYILPFPRADAKDSGEYAYGMQLRWENLFGLNHSTRVFWEMRDTKREGVGEENRYSLDYGIPQIADSRYSLGFGAAYTERPLDRPDDPALSYQETFVGLSAGVSRSFSDGPPSQGWSAGLGLAWREQDTSGQNAIPAYGQLTALTSRVGYRDLHFDRYSDRGTAYGASLSVGADGVGSDYDETVYALDWRHLRRVGARAHQTLHGYAEAAVRHGGPPDNDRFELGGSGSLRGYESDFLEGDAYYRVAAEFLRPVWRDWLRALAVVEAGNVFERLDDASLSRVYASIGLGLRVRVDWFVNIELDLGYAIPIGDGGESGRVFFGRP